MGNLPREEKMENENGAQEPLESNAKKDLRVLENTDWVMASIQRFHSGTHPDPIIEKVLKRRMNLPSKKFLAPYPLRLFCTYGMIVVFCGIFWGVSWCFFSFFGFRGFLCELSAAMTTLLVALLGVAISHPMKIFDEAAIEKAGLEALRTVQRQTDGEQNSQNGTT